SNARPVEHGAQLRLHVVGEVMRQHIADVAEQCAASKAACSYQADHEERSEEYAKDHTEAEERGDADQRSRIRMMGIVEFLEKWDAMVNPPVHGILDERPGAKACEHSESPQSCGFETSMRECHGGEHGYGDRTRDEITEI